MQASMSCPARYAFDTTPRVSPYAAATETYEPGQRIKHWDHDIIWTKNHLPASKLEPLRRLGDPLADDALAALHIKPGEDALEALLAYTAQPLDEQKSSAPQQLLTQVMAVPEWVDWDRLERGQQVYSQYDLLIQTAYLHFAISSTHTMPTTMKVFQTTGYFFGKDTKQRIVQTSQLVRHVVHSPEYLRPGSGIAWKSMVRVRFLHAGVRARFAKISRNHPRYHNIEEYGVPINQEDLLSGIVSLSALMWQVMERRLGVHMTTQEREDYMHLWRYAGYMMGVNDILGVTQTSERADACLDSIILHLAAPDANSGQQVLTWARNLNPPSRKFLGVLARYNLHLALAEHLTGSEGWKIQGLPSMTWPYRVVKEIILSSMVFDLWLVKKSSWWFHFRSSVLRELARRGISKWLGKKQTRFEQKEEPKVRGDEPAPDSKVGEDDISISPYAAATETYEPGQRIKHWDHDIIWTKNHLPASKLEPLRRLGDPLADDALAALEIKPGDDALEALLAYTAQPLEEQKSPAPQQLLTQVMTVPDWVDWDGLQRGQQVYGRYFLPLKIAIIHCALAGSTSAPKVMKVLNSTDYLFGKHSKQRIAETAQFVQQMVHSPEYLQPGSGPAWKALIQIRFRHSGVRARFLKITRNHPKYHNIEEYGVPINQEDLLSGIFTLSALMWRVMETRLDVHMTSQEREDYMHLWRYAGYMIGVDDILGVTQTPERADACLDSIVLHLSAPDADSGQLLSAWIRHLHPPSRKFLGILDRYKLHMALAEQLIGPECWKIQGLPSMTWPYKTVKDLILYIMTCDVWLVRKSTWWFRFRTPVLRKLTSRALSKKLGNKRTRFEQKEESKGRGNKLEPGREMGENSISSGQLWPL
ncbi:hypothetical protein EC968_004504 [Mortierella alpina]|nr:hypothetical protein EC968_004504 [Mortierella alpina]